MPNSVKSDESGRYNILFLTTDQTYAHAPRPEGYELPNRQSGTSNADAYGSTPTRGGEQ